MKIRDGISEGGEGWFALCVRRRVGYRVDTDFWRDCWRVNVQLCERFRRLYDLDVNKVVTVWNVFLLGLEVGGAVAVAPSFVSLGGRVGRGV